MFLILNVTDFLQDYTSSERSDSKIHAGLPLAGPVHLPNIRHDDPLMQFRYSNDYSDPTYSDTYFKVCIPILFLSHIKNVQSFFFISNRQNHFIKIYKMMCDIVVLSQNTHLKKTLIKFDEIVSEFIVSNNVTRLHITHIIDCFYFQNR